MRGPAIEDWASRHPISEPFSDSDLTPVITCCVADLPDALDLVLDLGADPDVSDDSGWSPLHWCAQSSRPDCAMILLRRGSDPDAIFSAEPASPLHFAATSGCQISAALIAKAGADMQRLERESQATAAHWACHDPGWLEAVGSCMPGLDGFGRGPLHWAVEHAKDEDQAISACQTWLGLGADSSWRDRFGLAPMDAAVLRGFHQCAKLLQSRTDWIALQDSVAIFEDACEGGPARL